MEAREYISSGLLELYVLGMATEQETAELLSMAERYPEVKEELRSIEQSLEGYAQIHSITPGSHLKNRLISATNQANPHSSVKTGQAGNPATVVTIAPAWKYLAAASTLLFIGSIFLNLTYYSKYKVAVKEKIHSEEQLLAQQRVNEEMQQNLSVIQSKFSVPVSLDPMPDAPDAAAKIFWMKNTTGEVYIDPSNLPEAPNGMQYQFWGIVNGVPVDGGLIITTNKENKYRIQKMKTIFTGVKVDAFAVTLETAGGNPQPKGKMYVLGKM